MPAPFDGYVEKPARVSGTCLVSVASGTTRCLASWPVSISTRLYPSRVLIVAHDTLVASHERLSARGQTHPAGSTTSRCCRKPGALRNGAPFADMPEPLQRLRRAILREEGGDRVMAQGAQRIIPDAGLDAVLVAVELALESTAPSGRVSVEHVINVLSSPERRTSSGLCRDHLQVSTPPLADTARYDGLPRPMHTPWPPQQWSVERRPTMREVSTELKALRLQRGASLEQPAVRARQGFGCGGDARWLISTYCRRRQQIALCARSITRWPAPKFPIHRDLAGFDFDVSPVDRNLIEQLAQLTFTEQAHNVVLVEAQAWLNASGHCTGQWQAYPPRQASTLLLHHRSGQCAGAGESTRQNGTRHCHELAAHGSGHSR